MSKSTLVQRLTDFFRTDLMLELVEENPFLPKFYSDSRAVALATQLYFLFQRVRQTESLR